ncbi:MAG: hypothetical protein ACD_21C00083G0006 [uncultured bacterium]|nr:MAG: hypothetical protein ACD_21C00083G0006 [uncultured bacterium]
MRPINRNLETKIHLLLKQFPIIAIVGARQVGKTTLAKKAAPNWQYFDLENPRDYDRISYDPAFFLQQNKQHVIFDEVQEYPDLLRSLRGAIDSQREQKGRFILTGSSSLDLLDHISETLAGRIAIVEVGTLKTNEYYQLPLSPFYDIFSTKLTKEKLNLSKKPPISIAEMQHIWLQGGYPEPMLQNNKNFYNNWMENYRSTYVNRDIAKLFPRLNKIAFRNFLHILSKLSGTIINRSNLARTLEISEGSVREYLKIAEDTFIWRNLPSFEHNIIKAVIKMSRGFMRDSGLLHNFLRIDNQEALYNDPIRGQSFEAFITEELIKGLQATTVTNWQAYYYRTRGGAEIDLLLDGPFGLLPIEIKCATIIPPKQLTALTQFVIEHKLPFGILINQSEQITWLNQHVVQIGAGWI